MSISDTRNAQKYASIAEAAAAQAKISATELENAPQYAQQAAASATAASSSAQAAISAESTVQSLSNAASQSASQAAVSASEASSAADSAIGRTVRAPEGEQLSALPSASERASKVPVFSGDGSLAVKALAEFAVLDSSGKIPVSVIPAIALTEPFVANSQAAMLALDAQVGDICKRTDLGYSFCLASSPASTLANWIQLTDDVLAQLGQKTGATQVGAADDSNNPTTVQAALNSKVSTSALSQTAGATLVGYTTGTVATQLDALDSRLDVVEAFNNQLPTSAGAQSVGLESSYQLSDWYSDETAGHVSVLKFIPKNLHQYLTNYTQSQNNAGDLITYFNQASTYCENNHKDLRVPFGYYFISDTFILPAACSVVGEGYPYLLATSTFSSRNIMVSCDKTGQPTYNMNGFNINGNSNINLTGLRIGGCRNSSFRAIVVTNCPAAAVDVYPTVTTSGDVENLELNHVWSVLSGGLLMRCNASISRGNITDAEVINCQLTTGDATTVGTPAIRMNGATGKELFGVKFDRVFTKTTDNDHIVINPNGGKVYHNVFSHMSGESWTVAAGGISNSFSKNALFVFDGEFTANTFRDFYGQGVPGNGITLGAGSSGNVFDSLRFLDKNIVGFNNIWLRIPAGAIANNFTSVYFDQSFNRANTGYGAVAANYIFRSSDGKIIDLSGSTRFDSEEMRSIAPTLVKRANIFAITSGQLANYPVSGCSFSSTANGVSIAVPSGSTAYFLTIPFTPTAGFAGKFVGFTVRYVCGAMNGMTLSADICGSGSSMTDITQNKVNVFSAYGAYNSSNKTVTITFGGTRTEQANLELQDIIITEGACIPYMPNFTKLYLES